MFNWITLSILNRVASVKQMDSYQEVAYNISNSNRGYIFLISAAKFIFLAITAAFSLDYTANYLAQLSLLGRTDMTSGQIYGVYFAWVLVIAAMLYYVYYRLSTAHKWNSLVWFAYIFGACFLAQFVMVLVTLICAAGHTNDGIKSSPLYTQMQRNGWSLTAYSLPSTNATAEQSECDAN